MYDHVPSDLCSMYWILVDAWGNYCRDIKCLHQSRFRRLPSFLKTTLQHYLEQLNRLLQNAEALLVVDGDMIHASHWINVDSMSEVASFSERMRVMQIVTKKWVSEMQKKNWLLLSIVFFSKKVKTSKFLPIMDALEVCFEIKQMDADSSQKISTFFQTASMSLPAHVL